MKMQIVLLLSFFFVISSCESIDIKPFTKDMYLSRYKSFIQYIELNYTSFNAVEWQHHDTTYMHYSEAWHSDFKPQMTPDERLFTKEMALKYHYYKLLATGNNVGKSLEQWLLNAENETMK